LTEAQWALINAGMRDLGVRDDSDLARRLGVKPQTVWKWRRNDRTPSSDAMEAIARLFNLTLAQLADPEGYAEAIGTSDSVAGVVRPTGPRSSARDLDIYDGVGAATKLSDLEDAMSPMERRPAPEGYEAEIGPNGIGVLVRGESMAGWQKRPIHHGDTAWLNPRDNRRVRGVVIAIVRESEDSEPKAVIKFHDGDGGLWSVPVDGARERFRVHELLDMAPVIVLTSPPGEP
jgi:transcriptional regulator with XRE-family HTH domain